MKGKTQDFNSGSLSSAVSITKLCCLCTIGIIILTCSSQHDMRLKQDDREVESFRER